MHLFDTWRAHFDLQPEELALESEDFDLEQALLEVEWLAWDGKSSDFRLEQPLLDLDLMDSVLDRGRFEVDPGLIELEIRRFSGKIRLLGIEQPSLDEPIRRIEVERPPLAPQIRPLEVEQRLIAVDQAQLCWSRRPVGSPWRRAIFPSRPTNSRPPVSRRDEGETLTPGSSLTTEAKPRRSRRLSR